MNAGFWAVANSHVGVVRQGNEDAGLASARLLAVADGMGGHAAGEVASSAVIRTLHEGLETLPTEMSAVEDWLLEVVNDAHGVLPGGLRHGTRNEFPRSGASRCRGKSGGPDSLGTPAAFRAWDG